MNIPFYPLLKRANRILASALLLTLAFPMASSADSDVTAELRDQNTPSGWTAVSLPSIPEITSSNTITITDATYGASTSSTDNTTAIQAALDAVPSTGGMVVIPAGTYLCGPLTINSKTVLHLAAGATLKLLPYGTYPDNGTTGSKGKNYNMFLTNAKNSTDIIVEGEDSTTSIIEGQGGDWWTNYNSIGTRPPLIRFTTGSNFLFRNFKLQNSPGTNITLGQSGKASNFTVHSLTISNPSSISKEATADGYSQVSHNTDGIPVWGPYVNIYNCTIDTGDDNVVFDSGSQYGHVWSCTFKRGHGASFGSYTEKVKHIIYEGITFKNTAAGFKIKTQRGRSGNDQSGTDSNGSVSDIICRNSTMTGVTEPLVFTTHYDNEVEGVDTMTSKTITYQTPEYCNILIQNVTSTNIGSAYSGFNRQNAIYICGLPELYIHDITFDNVSVETTKGMFMAYCKNIYFKNKCKITNTKSSSTYFAKKYEATVYGNYDGTANAEYDDSESGDSGESGETGMLTWDYTDAAPTSSPDNGLTYSGTVSDAAGTNNGLKGIKLNSTGYCYFTKSAVAGTLSTIFPYSSTIYSSKQQLNI